MSDQPLDKGFKDSIERDPEGFALAFGAVPAEPGSAYAPVEREQVLPALPLDQMIRVAAPSGEHLLHFEAFAVYRSDVPEKVLWHAAGAGYKFRMPVYSTALIYQPGDCPRVIPPDAAVRLGWLGFSARFHAVRMWEEPAARILDLDRLALLPLVPFMKTSAGELIEAGRRLERSGDEGLLTWYCIYVKARYNEDVVNEILGRFVKMVPMELVLESEYGRKLTARATEIGRAEGEEAGLRKGLALRREEARSAIRTFVAIRFPGVDARGLDRVDSLDRLHALRDAIFVADDSATVRRLLDNGD